MFYAYCRFGTRYITFSFTGISVLLCNIQCWICWILNSNYMLVLTRIIFLRVNIYRCDNVNYITFSKCCLILFPFWGFNSVCRKFFFFFVGLLTFNIRNMLVHIFPSNSHQSQCYIENLSYRHGIVNCCSSSSNEIFNKFVI